MNAKFLTPGNYFGVADFPEGAVEVAVKIVAVHVEDVEDEKNKTKRKGAITLEGYDKLWLSNVTNTKCLVAMFGDETDAWIGKRLLLCQERVMSFGEWVLGVRIKGSPDLAKPVSLKLKLRKKKDQVLTMQRTGPAPTAAGNGKPPTPYERMWNAWKAAGHTNGDAFKALVKSSTGKDTRALVDADVATFAAALTAQSAPPPPDEDEAAAIIAAEHAMASEAGRQ